MKQVGMISKVGSDGAELSFPCLIIDTSQTFCQFSVVVERRANVNSACKSKFVSINGFEYLLSIPKPRSSYEPLQGMAEVIDYDLREFLESVNFLIRDIKSIICSVGPGSFTGLRTGLAFSKGLQFNLEVPLFFCTNLLAAGLFVLGQTKNNLIKMTLTANKEENFICTLGVENGFPTSLTEIGVESKDFGTLNENITLIDVLDLEGFEIIEGYLKAVILMNSNYSEYSKVISVIGTQAKNYESELSTVEPIYVKGVSALTLIERGIKSPLDQIEGLK